MQKVRQNTTAYFGRLCEGGLWLFRVQQLLKELHSSLDPFTVM